MNIFNYILSNEYQIIPVSPDKLPDAPVNVVRWLASAVLVSKAWLWRLKCKEIKQNLRICDKYLCDYLITSFMLFIDAAMLLRSLNSFAMEESSSPWVPFFEDLNNSILSLFRWIVAFNDSEWKQSIKKSTKHQNNTNDIEKKHKTNRRVFEFSCIIKVDLMVSLYESFLLMWGWQHWRTIPHTTNTFC